MINSAECQYAHYDSTKDSIVRELEQAIIQKEDYIDILEHKLKLKDERIRELEHASVKNGLLLKVIRFYDINIVERTFPAGTKGREAYDAGLFFMKRLASYLKHLALKYTAFPRGIFNKFLAVWQRTISKILH